MNRNKWFSVILILSLCSLRVFAAEKKAGEVMSLSQIDDLIKETRYDQALEELNRFIDENPEKFDSAQSRIGKIMNARNRYSQLAEELIRVIMEEPDNSEKIYKITYELEHLEKYPTDRQLAFIRETRLASEFSYFRKEYIRIHQESKDLVEKGEYVSAANKAKEGFTLYQEEFFEDWTDEDIVIPVKEALTQVDTSVAQYGSIQKALTDSVSDFVNAVNQEDQKAIGEAWQNVQTNFIEFAAIRNRIYDSGETFRSVYEKCREISGDEDSTDASFLPFVTRFTVGQADNQGTGIAGAMDTQWYSEMNRMKNAVDEKLDGYVQSFAISMPEKLMESEKSVLSMTVLPTIRQFSNLAVRVNSLNNQLEPDIYEEDTRAYERESRYAYDLPVRTEDLYGIRERILSRFDRAISMKAPENPVEAEMNGSTFPKDLLEALSSISFTSEEKEFLDTVSDIELKKTNLQNMTKRFSRYTEELFAYTRDTLVSGTETFCNYVKTAGNGFVAESRADYEKARLLFDGESSDQTAIVAKYPERSQNAVVVLNKKIDAQIDIIKEHLGLLSGLSELKANDTTGNELNDCIAALDKYKTYSLDLAEACRLQIQSSQRAINEAELRFRQAEVALQSENFDTARKRLQDSRLKYNEALAISFSENLQSESDSRLMQLGDRIIQKENEIVVADVRKLKTQAKNEYYSGNFEQAENLLTQATARWAVTNVEEDMEITSLRALVNSALSMKTGRVILPSAPLYPEMSQILNIASQYYMEGEELIKKGERDNGVVAMKNALQKIQEVQLVYPLNQDASLLSLRIQKVLNPADFDAMFARKVSEAKASYKDKNRAQESYADLLDLYEINSKYPGLKDLIYNVELEIGIRQKPVTKVVSNRSQDLTKEAQGIFNRAKGDENQLKNALAKLDEAISLNPNNSNAIELKDKIQVSIGGKASAVLSAEDESRYQTAILELQKNNIITANAIVEQLLQKDSNKNSTKIQELRKKIRALL